MAIQDRVFASLSKEMGDDCSTVLASFAQPIVRNLSRAYAYFASPRLDSRMSMWYYNPHDTEHVLRVLEWLDVLTPAESLSAYEMLVLYFAAWGHDLGMSMQEVELVQAYRRRFGDEVGKAEFWRTVHGQVSATGLADILAPYCDRSGWFTPALSEVICEAAQAHTTAFVDTPLELQISSRRVVIRRGLVWALLRLADQLDNSQTRLPPDDVVALALAHASVEGEPYTTSARHYLRRLITTEIDAEVRDGSVSICLSIARSAPTLKLEIEKRGAINGHDAVLGVVGEFSGELGMPQRTPELSGGQLLTWEDVIGSLTGDAYTAQLLRTYGLAPVWKVQSVGYEPVGGKTEKIRLWESKARENLALMKQLASVPPTSGTSGCATTPEIRVPSAVDFENRAAEFGDCLRALQDGKCVVIVGPAGIGKTYLATRLAEFHDRELAQTFYLPLGHVQEIEQVVENIGMYLTQRGIGLLGDASLDPALKQDLAVKLLDRHSRFTIVDDADSFNNDLSARRYLASFGKNLSRTRVVFASRKLPSFARRSDGRYHVIRLTGFDFETWVGILSRLTAKELNRADIRRYYNRFDGSPLAFRLMPATFGSVVGA